MEYLKKLRKELNFTQKEMAEFLMINYRTYTKYESGERSTSGMALSTALRLQEKTNCDLKKLIRA